MGEAVKVGIGAGGLQEISISSSQFCCELKIAPQIKAVENIMKVGELTNIQELPIKQFLKFYTNIYINNNLYSCIIGKAESLFLLDQLFLCCCCCC